MDSAKTPARSNSAVTSLHLPGLDGLRAIAVMEVLFYHCRVPNVRAGWLGVDLFFALSGFLITRILVAEYRGSGTISFRKFYWKRFLRIYPALITMVFVYVLVGWHYHRGAGALFVESALTLFGVANWSRALGYSRPYDLGQLWSLSIELQLYLLWAPLVYYTMRGRKSAKLLTAICFGLLAVAVGQRVILVLCRVGSEQAYNVLTARLDSYVCGAIAGIASLVPASAPRSPWIKRFMIALVLGAIALHFYLVNTLWFGIWNRITIYPTVIGISSALMVWGAAFNAPRLYSRFLSLPPIRYLGLISYGIFLWHYPILRLSRFHSWQAWPKLGGVICVSFVFASLSYHLIEKRFLRLKRPKPPVELAPTVEDAPPDTSQRLAV